jgi:hypothetical protein
LCANAQPESARNGDSQRGRAQVIYTCPLPCLGLGARKLGALGLEQNQRADATFRRNCNRRFDLEMWPGLNGFGVAGLEMAREVKVGSQK